MILNWDDYLQWHWQAVCFEDLCQQNCPLSLVKVLFKCLFLIVSWWINKCESGHIGTLKTPKALSSEIFRKNSLTPFLLICPTVTTMNEQRLDYALRGPARVRVFSRNCSVSAPLDWRWSGDRSQPLIPILETRFPHFPGSFAAQIIVWPRHRFGSSLIIPRRKRSGRSEAEDAANDSAHDKWPVITCGQQFLFEGIQPQSASQ